MKTLTLSILAIFFSFLSYGQGQNVTLPMAGHLSDVSVAANQAELASMEKSEYYNDYGAWVSKTTGTPEKCAKYKKFKTIGIVLSSVGGALLITGGVLVNVGGDAYSGSYIHSNNYGMIAGGAAMIGVALPSIGAGITLAVIGSVKYKKYCRHTDRSYLQLHNGANGLGLAMKF